MILAGWLISLRIIINEETTKDSIKLSFPKILVNNSSGILVGESDGIPLKEMSSSKREVGGESKGEHFLPAFHWVPRIHYNQPNSSLK